jgi:hypothetical protein
VGAIVESRRFRSSRPHIKDRKKLLTGTYCRI